MNPPPIYQLQQEVSLAGNQHVLWCVLLGALASLVASFWLLILKKSRRYLNGKRQWLPVRLTAAGVLVGAIAIFYPEIVGNGKISSPPSFIMNLTPREPPSCCS